MTVPAIVFGGGYNAVSIVRQLGRRGVPVHTLNKPSASVHASRYARRLTLPDSDPYPQAAAAFLLGPASDRLRGAVLLTASDEALEILIAQHAELSEKFVLDICNVEAQAAMLNKLETYRLAGHAGIPLPRYWTVSSTADLDGIRDELVFPLLVKPRLSHLFQEKFRAKFLLARDTVELDDALQVVEQAGVDVLLMEQIPGPDSRLCSYYTYLDEQGTPLFDFTKRIIRRYPAGMGLACYHVTDQVDGVKDLALRLFREAGLIGVANAEFKLDERDGQLKLMECNARFTAADCLLASSGIDLAWFVYCRLTGQPTEALDTFRTGVHLWDPIRDFTAFLERRRTGEMSLPAWLADVCRRHTFPLFSWTDPRPSLVSASRVFTRNRRQDP